MHPGRDRVAPPSEGSAARSSRGEGPLRSAQLMPAAEQADAMVAMQMSDAERKPSLTTVDSMFAEVTQIGVSSTDETSALACESWVVPLASAAGGVSPARR